MRSACPLRLSTMAGLVPVLLLLPATRLAVKFRSTFAVRLAALLRSCRVTRIVASTSIVIGVAGFVQRRVLLQRRLTWGSVCHRFDTDAVFLIRTSDLDGEGSCDSLGNFELGGGVQNPDGANVTLVDAATTANHRQEPARLRILSSSNGGPEPYAGLRHVVTRR